MIFSTAILAYFAIETVLTLPITPNAPRQPNRAAEPQIPGVMVQPAPGLGAGAANPTANLLQQILSNVAQPQLGSKPLLGGASPNFDGNPAPLQRESSYPFGQNQKAGGKWDKQLENDVWPNKTTENLYSDYLSAFHEVKALYNRQMPTYEEEKRAFLHFVKKTHYNIEKDMAKKLGVMAAAPDSGNSERIVPLGTDMSIGQPRGDQAMQRPPISAAFGNAQLTSPNAPVQNAMVTKPQKPFSRRGPIVPSIAKKPLIFKDKLAGGRGKGKHYSSSRSSSTSSSTWTISTKMIMSSEGGFKSTTNPSSTQMVSKSGKTNGAGSPTTASPAAAAPKRSAPISM